MTSLTSGNPVDMSPCPKGLSARSAPRAAARISRAQSSQRRRTKPTPMCCAWIADTGICRSRHRRESWSAGLMAIVRNRFRLGLEHASGRGTGMTPQNQMSSEAQNHDDPIDVRRHGNMVLPGLVVGTGFLTFIWHFDFSI